jgi:hypothetical protein
VNLRERRRRRAEACGEPFDDPALESFDRTQRAPQSIAEISRARFEQPRTGRPVATDITKYRSHIGFSAQSFQSFMQSGVGSAPFLDSTQIATCLHRPPDLTAVGDGLSVAAARLLRNTPLQTPGYGPRRPVVSVSLLTSPLVHGSPRRAPQTAVVPSSKETITPVLK